MTIKPEALRQRLLDHAACHESDHWLMAEDEQRQWAADLREADALIGRLHAECEELRADAERLDYLQATGSTVDLPAICVPGRQPMVLAFRVGGLARAVNRDLRAAIDAARAAKEQSK